MCNHHSYLIPKCFVTSKRNPVESLSTSNPSLWQPLIYFVSLWICYSECFIYISLLSLSMMILRYVHVVACSCIFSFLWLNNIPLYIYIYIKYRYHVLFLHLLIDRYMDCFHFWLLWLSLLWTSFCVNMFWVPL